MREIAIAAVALLLGAVLGGVGPRSQIKVFEDKLDGRVASAKKCKSGVGRDLATFMGSGVGNSGSRPAPPPEAPEVVPVETHDGDTDAVPAAAEKPQRQDQPEVELEAEQEPDEFSREGRDIAAARTALELRRTQARAALIEHSDPDEEQMQVFDQAVGNMNDVLLGMSDELAEMLESGEEPARRDAMEFAAEALDTLLAAEDAMRASLGSEQLDGLPDSAVDPFSYVDPAIVDVLAQLEKPE